MTKKLSSTFTPLGNIDVQTFLSSIWQKKPLLIPNAYPNLNPLLNAQELAGLACEEEVEARIVINEVDDQWRLLNGSFEEADFTSLPKSHWTLLVQTVDLWVPEAVSLLEDFNFIPRWRRDDLMVSYATKGGGVGPHYDHYDVFLLQAQGQRRWEVGGHYNDQSPRNEDSPLLQLTDWQAEQTWTLGPGDMLYIPPGVGHNGIALDDDCMTYSIGFRAPSFSEILCGITDLASDHLASDQRFKDINLKAGAKAGEIRTEDIDQLSMLLHELAEDRALLTRWFGQSVTSLKYPELTEAIHDDGRLSAATLLKQDNLLTLSAGTRVAYHRSDTTLFFFVNEQEIPLQTSQEALVSSLCNLAQISTKEVAPSDENMALIQRLLDEEALVIS